MLRIKRIKLTNFMNISKADLDIEGDKVVLLVGPSGQGKSAIMESITISVTEMKRADSYKSYIKRGTKEAEIDISAEIGKDPISMYSKIQDKGVSRKVVYKGQTYENSEAVNLFKTLDIGKQADILFSMQSQVNITELTPMQRLGYLQELLKFDFSNQVESLKEQIAEKQQNINNLEERIQSNLSHLENMPTPAPVEMPYSEKEYSETLESLNDMLSKQSAVMANSQQREQTLKQIALTNNQISSLEMTKKDLQTELDNHNKSAELVKTLEKEIVDIDAKVAELTSQIIPINAQLDDLKKAKVDKENVAILKDRYNVAFAKGNDIKAAQEQVDNVERLLKESEDKSVEIKAEVDRTHSENIKAAQENVSIETEVSNLQKKSAELTSELKTANDMLETIASGVCPQCGQSTHTIDKKKYEDAKADVESRLAEVNDQIIEKKRLHTEKKMYAEEMSGKMMDAIRRQTACDTDIQNLKGRLNDCKATVNRIFGNLDPDYFKDISATTYEYYENGLKAILADIEKFKGRSDEYSEEKESELNDQIGKINQEIYAQNSRRNDKVAEKEKIESVDVTDLQAQIESMNASIGVRTKKVDELNKQLAELGDIDSGELDKLNSDIEVLRAKAGEYTAAQKAKEVYEANVKAYEEEKSRLGAEVEEARNNIAKFSDDIAKYSEAKTVFDKDLPNYMVVKTCAHLEEEMNDFIHVVFPEFEVRLYQNKKGVEFFYTPENDGKLTKEELLPAKMASGFQKAVLTMAFKVALIRAYNIPFTFLDEIDAAADDISSERLFSSLINADIFEQMFVISHKTSTVEMMRGLVDRVKSYSVKGGKFTEIE